jgi:hypothetical protein
MFDEAGSRTQEMRCIYLELDFRAADYLIDTNNGIGIIVI